MNPPLLHRFAAACRNRWVVLALCLSAALAAYAPALKGGLIWDDAYLVGENPFFRSPIFSLEVFRHYLFFDSFSTYYRPIQNWSYMLDYWFWRGNTAGYHLTNIALHAVAGFLLYSLLRRLLPALLDEVHARIAPFLAVMIAVLWVVHPVHNAAVAYISGRADSLAAVFALLAWLLTLRAKEATGGRRVLLVTGAVTTILVALCAKEIALMWLVLFLTHFWWKGDAGWRGRIATTVAVLMVLGIYAGLHSLPAHREAMENGAPAPLAARSLLMLRALGDYTRLMFFPGRLYMERALSDPDAMRSAASWRQLAGGEWLSVLGLLALLGSIQLCRWRAPGRSLRHAGAAWFAIAFLPISNLFPLNAEVAEHWIYLASIGFIALAAGAVIALPRRAQIWACGLATLAILGLGTRTAIRSGDWVEAETFCQRTIAAGGATPRILSTLAGIYARRGEWTRQEKVLRATLARFPAYMPARIQLGVCLSKQGRAPEAERLLDLGGQNDETARRFPRTWPAVLNLAKLRRDAGDTDAALALLHEARSRFPEIWEVARYQSELVSTQQGAAAALPEVERFAAERWWHLDALLTLGRLRFAAGDLAGAVAAFQQASHLDLYDGRPLAAVAEIELAQNRPDLALATQCAAVARDPDRALRYLELGAILRQLGRQPEAEAALRKAQLLTGRSRKS